MKIKIDSSQGKKPIKMGIIAISSSDIKALSLKNYDSGHNACYGTYTVGEFEVPNKGLYYINVVSASKEPSYALRIENGKVDKIAYIKDLKAQGFRAKSEFNESGVNNFNNF